MGRITIDNLSNSLKEYLAGLGLSEEQVEGVVERISGDLENLATEDKDNLVDALNELVGKDVEIQREIGNLGGLATEAKGSLVDAINELFQNVDSGKTIIADAIDNININKDSTFAAMGEAIEGIHADREEDRQKLIEILQGSNIELNGNESMDTLLDLINMSNLNLNKVVQMDGGSGFSYILYEDGSLYSCGVNNYGQLGLGDTTNRAIFTQVTTNINNDVKQVACGSGFTLIVKNDGSLWATGYNYDGQLGLGTSGSNTNKTTFTQVTTNINNDVKQVACGNDHSVIIKNDGSVWGTGDNYRGQLGIGSSGTTSADKKVFTQATTNINNDVKQVACGSAHTAILKNDGSVWATGYNQYGTLGLNTTTDKATFTQVTTNVNNDVKQIDCLANEIIILKNDGSVWGCGYNDKGQLGLGDTSSRKTFTQITTNGKKISSNNSSTLILKNDGSLWGCGSNDGGQLGCDGDTASMSPMNKSLTQVTVNINNDVKEIFCGYNHSLIIKNDGSLWVAGSNTYGQLGLGDANSRNRFTELVNSDSLNKVISQLQTEAVINRGSLVDVLTDEGVNLTGDETLADLIVKTDEEFDRQVVPAGDAVASNVIAGKTFINSTGQLVTGTIPNMPTHTPIADYVAWNDEAVYMGISPGAYLTPTGVGIPEVFIEKTRLDPNLVPENIVSGKSICGINGTARKLDIPSWYTDGGIWLKSLINGTAIAMPEATRGHSSTVIDNRYIYCVGGSNSSSIKSTNYCLDTLENTWSTKANMPKASSSLTVESYNNKIYVIGGSDGTGSYGKLSQNVCYDIVADSWTSCKSCPTSGFGYGHGCINGLIYCIAGYSYPSNLTTNRVYDILTDTWSTKNDVSITYNGNCSVTIGDKIYFMSGETKHYCYDSISDTITTKANLDINKMSSGTYDVSGYSTATNGRSIYMFGGYGGDSYLTSKTYCYKYDINNDSWTKQSDSFVDRYNSSAEFANGCFYCFGGYREVVSDSYTTLSSVEIYIPFD